MIRRTPRSTRLTHSSPTRRSSDLHRAGGLADRMAGQRDALAVGYHVELLQVGGEALKTLVVGQHRVSGKAPGVPIPHAEQAEDDRQVGSQPRRTEVLVHLVGALDESRTAPQPARTNTHKSQSH